MAEQSEEKKNINQEKTNTKKVATGSTKKAVQKRSSSVAGKKQDDTKKAKKEKQTKTSQKEEKAVIKENEMKEIEKVVAKEIKSNKKIPQTEQNKMNTRIFEEVCFAIITMFYLNFIILGFINIETNVFLTDLKVFGIAILVLAIGIFEYAYKKDSGRYCVHGIEMLLLAFTTMGLLYVQLMLEAKFIYIVALITFLFAIYYIAKSIIIYHRMKKQYVIDNMKEMIKK